MRHALRPANSLPAPGAALALALALGLLAGCPPTGLQDSADDTKLDDGDDDDDADADTDTDTDADADADADADSDADADADSDADADADVCSAGPATPGPWAGHPISEAGSAITRDPYTFDAGVGALLAATAGQTTDTTVDIEISGAIVTSRGYVPASPSMNTVSFWFEDASGPMYAFNVDIGFNPNDLAPGDAVSFTATTVQEYFGTPELKAVTGFTILSSGNDVHVVDIMSTTDPLTFEDHGMYTVEVWGGLVGGPIDCGANCFDLDYGNGRLVTYRTTSTFDYLGDCKHFIGPLTQFSSSPQLDVNDYDWAEYY